MPAESRPPENSDAGRKLALRITGVLTFDAKLAIVRSAFGPRYRNPVLTGQGFDKLGFHQRAKENTLGRIVIAINSTVVGMKIVMPLAVIVRAVPLKDWIFPSTSKICRAGSLGGAMSTGTQGACAIAVTEVNTNRQVIMRAGLRTWVMKLYFLFEDIYF
ncbi:MAG TPA: hypothetical protein VLB46_20610 [Pyrinomonadaceae bacterium]|nr:hypothetical protein [Pyrinomonadaceae bacterium]